MKKKILPLLLAGVIFTPFANAQVDYTKYLSQDQQDKLSKESQVYFKQLVLSKDKTSTTKEVEDVKATLVSAAEKEKYSNLSEKMRVYSENKDKSKLNDEEVILASVVDQLSEKKQKKVANGYTAGVVRIKPGQTIKKEDVQPLIVFEKSTGENFEITGISKVPTTKDTETKKIGDTGEFLVHVSYKDKSQQLKTKDIQMSYELSKESSIKAIPSENQVLATISKEPVPEPVTTTTVATTTVAKDGEVKELPETNGLDPAVEKSLIGLLFAGIFGAYISMKKVFSNK